MAAVDEAMKLAYSIAESLFIGEGISSVTETCLIQRVPPNIRRRNPDAYEPQFLSIGPYHHGKPDLQSAQHHKRRYLRNLLSRNQQVITGDDKLTELAKFIRKVKELEGEARRCYLDVITVSNPEFLTMMVLDGCFLVELLIKFYMREKNDPIFAVPWILPLIRRDLLKLENQFPFFLLEHIFALTVKPVSRTTNSGRLVPFPTSLKEIASVYLKVDRLPDGDRDALSDLNVQHFLHLRYWLLWPKKSLPQTIVSAQQQSMPPSSREDSLLPTFIRSRFKSKPPKNWPTSTIPSAAELREAGVHFRCKNAKSFMDIEFRGKTLKIPFLSIRDSTDTIFRNLLAFEQCLPDVHADDISKSKPFTSYILFMDCIVNTPRDVAILKEHRIFENKLGSDEEVALLLNQFLKEIIIDYDKHYFCKLFQNVNKHCGSTWNSNKAALRRDYFSNPWRSMAVIAASIVVALTIMQTVYAAMTYHKTFK